MVKQSGRTAFHDYLSGWVAARGTTFDALRKAAGLSSGTASNLRHGGMPTPLTVRKLAPALGMSPGRLFILAGYLEEADLVAGTEPLTAEESSLLSAYRTLTEEGRSLLLGALRGMLRRPGSAAPLPPGSSRRGRRLAGPR